MYAIRSYYEQQQRRRRDLAVAVAQFVGGSIEELFVLGGGQLLIEHQPLVRVGDIV